MRFLLYQHPTVRSLVGPAAGSTKPKTPSSGAAGSRTVVKLRRKLDRRRGDNATTTTTPTKYDRIPSPSTPTNPTTTTVVSRDSWRLDSTRRTTIPTNHNHNKKENGGKLAWGQQCSPTCACVVRFEATVDATTGTIEQVSYHAKQLVTTPSSSSSPSMVQVTRHGRPLVQDCPCHTLHALSQASLHHMIHQQQTWHGLQSSLEFRSTRSSRAFVRSVLRAQGLPVTHTHCVDVVEEALTALCKGYLPRPRVSDVETLQNSSAPTIPSPPPSPPNHYQYSSRDDNDDDIEDDDHYHFLKFGHSWRHDPHGLPNTLFSSRGESHSTTAMNTTTTALTRDEPWLLTFLLDSMEYWNGSSFSSTTTATTTTTTSPDSTTSGTMEEWHDPSHEEEYPVSSSSSARHSSSPSSPSNDWIAYIDERNAQLDREAAAQEQELAVTTSSSTSSAAL